MGLTDDFRLGWDVPAAVDGHRIWYAGAVGTEDLMADVVLERAADAGAELGDAIEIVRAGAGGSVTEPADVDGTAGTTKRVTDRG